MTMTIVRAFIAGRGRFAALPMFCAFWLLVAARPCGAVTIEVENLDSPFEGFNDPTVVAPVGGNPGTTLGAQRLIAFQYAADAWGLRLAGTVPVVIGASFDSLGGTSVSAVLGAAGPYTLIRDFPYAEHAGTWYVAAAANQQADMDINDTDVEVVAQFNSSVDNQVVLGAVDFYYGLDGHPGTDIDFVTVVLHEIAHGLGFLDLLDAGTGAKFYGYDDAYLLWLEDEKMTPKALSLMTDGQRKTAMVDTGRLVWTGPSVKATGHYLVSGRRADGRVEMYAPNPYQEGSSVGHVNVTLFPNELMEPFATTVLRDLRLTTAVLDDVGWTPVRVPACADPDDDAVVTSADALIALQTAVGIRSCGRSVCDVDFSGEVDAADALNILRLAVGQSIQLDCPLA